MPPLDRDDILLVLKNQAIPVSAHPFKEKLENGTYLNALSESDTVFVPRVSYLQLYSAAIEMIKSNNNDPIGLALKEFVGNVIVAKLYGRPFELFHAYFERAKIQAYAHKATMKLNEFYGRGKMMHEIVLITI